MIQKLRKIIAYTTSLFLLTLSLGLYKPNFSGKATISEPTYNGKSAISLGVEDNNREDLPDSKS